MNNVRHIQVWLRVALITLLSSCGGSGGGNDSTGATVDGQVVGLEGELTITLNGTESLTIHGARPFGFSTRLVSGSAYVVAITAQPHGEECQIPNSSGKASGYVVIYCSPLEPPAIASVWPGSLLGGYAVTISGSNLSRVSVAYNGVAVEPTLQTSDEIRFIAPENPQGIYKLELENSAGSASLDVPQGAIMSGVVAVDSGSQFSCAALDTGQVACWGNNELGQLGDGTTTNSTTPVSVFSLSNAVSVSAGAQHSCAVLSSGSVRCWGSNYYGQLGDGTTANSTTPVLVFGINNAVSVSAGSGHSCAVLSTGSVQCWGENSYGKLGDGDDGSTIYRTTPVTVAGITDAKAVSTSREHTCAVLGSGEVQCWGANFDGQLGIGMFSYNSPIPVTVSGIDIAIAVSGNRYLSGAPAGTGAVLSTGVVMWWDYWSTRAIPGITTAVKVAVGFGHACASLISGKVVCWGANSYGELGDGSFTDNSIPVEVAGINSAVNISSGLHHSCAQLGNSTAICWGDNTDGQLGLPLPASWLHQRSGQELPVYFQ